MGERLSEVLSELRVGPIPIAIARPIVERHHYLHSLPGGTCLALGVFQDMRLKGAAVLGVGSANAHHLVEGAGYDDCLTLTRLWLDNALPKNSESRAIGLILKALKRHTDVKFLISYADPSHGHLGIIYQATNWVYTGLSDATPLYDFGDGRARHSRSVSQTYGSHSIDYFSRHGISVARVPQVAKHRYVYFLDPRWHSRLTVSAHSYPKREESHAGH